MTTLGGVFCDLYSLVRESWRASRDWRWSFVTMTVKSLVNVNNVQVESLVNVNNLQVQVKSQAGLGPIT